MSHWKGVLVLALLFLDIGAAFVPASFPRQGLAALSRSKAPLQCANVCFASVDRSQRTSTSMMDPVFLHTVEVHSEGIPQALDTIRTQSGAFPDAVGALFSAAEVGGALHLTVSSPGSYSSLTNADAQLQRMIQAVEIGPGSQNLQLFLSTVVNTPGIRQILQVTLPPLSILVTNLIEAGLPLYIKFLDMVSKTGGHEGLLPDGIDVTMKAVQRLAAQGEILRAFKVLQAAWPSTKLRAGFIAAIGFGFYALAPPGLLFGLFDIYIVSPIDKFLETKFLGRDFTIGRRLGGGNFGTVFEARVLQSGADKIRLRGKRNGSEKRRVVLKRIVTDEEELRKNFARKTFFGTSLVGGTVARGNFETGKIESYFNERVRRYGFSGSFAQYLGAFVGGIRMKEDEAATVTLSAGQWLVWSYEGERTVDDYLSEDEFPYNIESAVLNKKNEGMEYSRRETEIIKNILWPVLAALRDIHRVGIVHRDVKPANLLVAQNGRPPIKVIDLGAAVDLRTGVNFNPETGLLDPKYAPPEQLVVPQEVPRAPPRFVALLGAPALWQLTSPDRFDTYSVGVMLMQMSVPELRQNRCLDKFKHQLQQSGEDLQRWRNDYGKNYDWTLLDRNGGLGWDLAKRLVRPRDILQRGRLSAAEAMGHRYFWPEF